MISLRSRTHRVHPTETPVLPPSPHNHPNHPLTPPPPAGRHGGARSRHQAICSTDGVYSLNRRSPSLQIEPGRDKPAEDQLPRTHPVQVNLCNLSPHTDTHTKTPTTGVWKQCGHRQDSVTV